MEKVMIKSVRHLFRSIPKYLAILLLWFFLLLTSAWTFGALWFDLPFQGIRHCIAWIYLAGVLGMVILFKPRRSAKIAVLLIFGGVLIWWFTLQPSNDREWQTDVSSTPWAEVHGDLVTLHEVRHFDYQAADKYTPYWETRIVRLSQLTGIDLAINYWGSPWIAHPIVSFQFADAAPIAMSIETRKQKGQSYSALGGFYRQFELIYIAAGERDVIRVRTNYRKGEDIYLYRTTISAADARERFLEYIAVINALHAHPRWYNAITANCTTAIRSQLAHTARSPFDWRLLINGKMDEMLYDRGVLMTDGLPFAELRKRALINPAAQAADQDPEFSLQIRENRPGFSKP